MRSTLFVTLFTLFLASLSFARTVRIAAPATVKKGKSFKVTFETESFREADTEFTAILGFSNDPSCENCIGTLAGAFDLLSQGHGDTSHGSFTETVKAPTTPGSYKLTAAIIDSVEGISVSIRELTPFTITVTN